MRTFVQHLLRTCFRDWPCQFRSIISFVLVGLLSFTLVVGWVPTVWAQFSIPTPSVQDSNKLPDGVQQLGGIEVATVNFVNAPLFEVASATIRNRKNPGKQIPVEERAKQIEANLNRVIAADPRQKWNITKEPTQKSLQKRDYDTNFDPKTLQVEVATLSGETVILATDAHHSRPQSLLTVTDLDADYYGLTVEELAQQWKSRIFQKLLQELKGRSPSAIKLRVVHACFVALIIIAMSLSLWIFQRLLRVQKQAFKAEQAAVMAESHSIPDISTVNTSSASYWQKLFNILQKLLGLEPQHCLNSLRWLLNWGQVVVWSFGITVTISTIFPDTKPLAMQIFKIPIRLLLIWFFVGLANRVGDLLINRFSKAWEDNHFFSIEDAQRNSLRIPTDVRVLKGLKTFTIWVVGVAYTLETLGVQIISVLAGGALVAFAFQNLVKDLVNGCLILWEDQYAIGDVIAVGSPVSNTSGLVEDMNLRVTKLRNGEGRLITIPNGAIAQVENLTRTWSRVDFTIEVAYDTDVKQALALIREIAQEMHNEPEWRDRIIESPEVLGVDNVSHTGMLIRVWIKTQPQEQWSVGREFRLRVRLALDEHSIHIGTPQQTFWYKNSSSPIVLNGQDGREHPSSKQQSPVEEP